MSKPITINARQFLKGFSLSQNLSNGFSPDSLGFEVDRNYDIGLLKAGRSSAEFSTNIADKVYASYLYYRSGALYYYSIGNAGKIYETTVVSDTPAHTVKNTDGAKTYNDYSSVLVYRGDLFVTSTTDIYRDDFTFTVNDNDWWTATKSKTALTSGVPHKLFEFQGVMFITNGNKLASWNGTTAVDAALTLPTGWIISDVLVDGSQMMITASFSRLQNWENVDTKIFIWDSYSNSWLREVTMDVPQISAIVKAENGYVFWAGRSMFFFDGYNYSWLRYLPGTYIPTYNQVKSFDGRIYFAVTGKGLWCYNTRLKSVTCPVKQTANTITCINIGYIDYIDYWVDDGTANSNFYRAKTNDDTTTFYSDLIDLGNGFIDKIELLFNAVLPANASYTVKVLDEAGTALQTITYNDTGKIKIEKPACSAKVSIFGISVQFGHSACVPIRHIKIYARGSEQLDTK